MAVARYNIYIYIYIYLNIRHKNMLWLLRYGLGGGTPQAFSGAAGGSP